MLAILFTLAAAAAAAPSGRQAAYDRAQAALDKGDWAAAAAGFAPLLTPEGKSSRIDGIMRSRYVYALEGLGRVNEAIAAAQRAVGEFAAASADQEHVDALLRVGHLLHYSYRLGEAGTAYEQARDLAPAGDAIRVLAGTDAVQALAVFDPPRAIADADRLMADPAYAKADKPTQAMLHALKARAQLNASDFKAARASIARAVSLSGAIGDSTVNLLQSMVRADAALIYARLGDEDQAREYLAFSGAGYLPKTGWWGDGNRQPPVCDGEVRPDDVAVVSFSIDEAGKPLGAETVYASRPGPMGAAFAEAVRGWEASPTVGKLSPFWRSSLRIEMRCVARPAPLAIEDDFTRASRAWWAARHAPDPARRREDKAAPAGAASADPATARIRTMLKGADDHGDRLLAVDSAAAEAGAPVAVRAVLARSIAGYRPDPARRAAMLTVADRLRALPDGARAAAWLTTELALAAERGGRFDEARPLLERVSTTGPAALDADDPIRTIATLHLSIIDRKQGAAGSAQDRLQRAGLDAEQCSLFDVHPLPVNQSVSDSIFPGAALRWSMEGYVKEAFDITADGRVSAIRTVIAYPPFVFGKATEAAVAHFRYLPPTLDGKVLGCASQMTSFRFAVPDR